MSAVTCGKCANKMNAQAIVCPHCGARREGAVQQKMSQEELRAFVDVAAPGYQAPRGLWKTLMWPHDETKGGVRTAETVLTVACLPFVLAGFSVIGIGRRLGRSRMLFAAPGEYAAAMYMTLIGSAVFALSVPYGVVLAIPEVLMLWARAWLRETSSRNYRLHALAKPEKPALPKPEQSVPKLVSAPPPQVQPSTSEPTLLK